MKRFSAAEIRFCGAAGWESRFLPFAFAQGRNEKDLFLAKGREADGDFADG